MMGERLQPMPSDEAVHRNPGRMDQGKEIRTTLNGCPDRSGTRPLAVDLAS